MGLIKKVVLSVYVGILFSLLINLYIGPTGIVEYRRLLNLRDKLDQHVALLATTNYFLKSDLANIQSNSSEIALRARDLGYYKENEGIIIVEGGTKVERGNSPGYLLSCQFEPLNNRSLLRGFSIIAGVAFFIFLLLFGKKKYAPVKRQSNIYSKEYILSEEKLPNYSPL